MRAMLLMTEGRRAGVFALTQERFSSKVVNAGCRGRLNQQGHIRQAFRPDTDPNGAALSLPAVQVNVQHDVDAGFTQSDGVEVVDVAGVAYFARVAWSSLQGGGVERDGNKLGQWQVC